MLFRLLCPVEAWADDVQVDLGPARQRCVLAVLAYEVGHPVSIDVLVDRVWDANPPPSARDTLYSYITRLRKALLAAGGPRVHRRQGGYVLDAAREQVDVWQFACLRDQATLAARQGRHAEAVELLDTALRLWRGEALADLTGLWSRTVRTTLAEQRLAVLEDRAEYQLRLGLYAQIVDALTPIVAEHPLREGFVGRLMTALHGSGRRADALELYRRTRRSMVDELGLDPSSALRQLEQDILAGKTLSPGPAKLSGASVTPAQLIRDVDTLIGRAAELASLDQLATRQASVVVITGPAGVGKTALAVHWAHRASRNFPDGQLYANLRGYDSDHEPISARTVLIGFLRALGVAEEKLSVSVDELAARFRSMVSSRRILVVLDNAADSRQVRPLLPGGSLAHVVITSRNRLDGLVASEGAKWLSLNVLSEDSAFALLTKLLPGLRLTLESPATRDLIKFCGGLPLALRIAVAQVTTGPQWTMDRLVVQLADECRRLALLTVEDDDTGVRAAFQPSYRALSVEAAALLRRLGSHAGHDFAIQFTAALLGVSSVRAEPLLEELTKAHLVEETGRDRYALHDLMRLYAVERAEDEDSSQCRADCLERIVGYYLATTEFAVTILNPGYHRIELNIRFPPTARPNLQNRSDTVRWYEDERANLSDTIRAAAKAELHSPCWQLVHVLYTLVHLRGGWTDWLELGHLGLSSARRLSDRKTEGHALNDVGLAHSQLGMHNEAKQFFRQAVEIWQELGDLDRAGVASSNLGLAHWGCGENEEALRHHRIAMEICRRNADRHGEAALLGNIGEIHRSMGDLTNALDVERESLALWRELDDIGGEGAILGNIGGIYRMLGEYDAALEYLRHAIELDIEAGNRYEQALALDNIGQVLHQTNRIPAARDCWEQALAILTELSAPEAEDVRRRLSDRD